MTDIPTQHLTVADIETNVAVVGDGPPILFMHGWGVDLKAMWPAAERIVKHGFTAHVLDFPGFGDSGLPPAAWTVGDYAKWVIAYLDTQGLDRVHLVGHSFGGRVSLMLGAEYPERIGKIVLSNSAGIKLPPSSRMRAYYLGRKILLGVLSLPGLGKQKEQARAYLRRRFGSTDYLNAGPLTETFVKVISEDLLPYAKRVQASTLLFWGDRDTDTPLAAGQILESNMPDAGLVLFEGAGHYAYLDNLSRFVEVVVYFFNQSPSELP